MRKRQSLNIATITLLIAICYLTPSCQKDVSADNEIQGSVNLQIHFQAVVDADPLVLNKMYKNAFSEDYSVRTFKFYIHGIELSNSQTNNIVKIDKNEHYLINAADPLASFITLHVPASSYDGIRFFIGVDSSRNVSGAQTGALDPAQGMFWTWSTGYIMVKLEGNSPVAATPNNVIEYHIGGFKGTESVIRKINLNFPPSEQIAPKPGSQSKITISANINRWFNQTNAIHISQKPVSMSPGSLATQIADNYATMFTVVEIVNE